MSCEQFGQPDEVVGGHLKCELRGELEESAVPHLAQPSDRLSPAESLLDAFQSENLKCLAPNTVTDKVLCSKP